MIPYSRSAMMSIVPTQEESPSARILESILARIDQARTFTFLHSRTNIYTNRTSGARARTQLLLQQDVCTCGALGVHSDRLFRYSLGAVMIVSGRWSRTVVEIELVWCTCSQRVGTGW